jgi:hypothetical protein
MARANGPGPARRGTTAAERRVTVPVSAPAAKEADGPMAQVPYLRLSQGTRRIRPHWQAWLSEQEACKLAA